MSQKRFPNEGIRVDTVMSERSCIITRESGLASAMIRFVAGPDGRLVADLKGNLPGRGAWLVTSRKILEKAMRLNVFSRSLKQNVCIDSDLADRLDSLLVRSAMSSLSLARRSGSVVTGAVKVQQAIRSGKVVMVLHALEAAEDGRRKIAQLIHSVTNLAVTDLGKRQQIETVAIFTADEMALAFGDQHVMHVALCSGGATAGFIRKVAQLVAYRGGDEVRSETIRAQAVKEAETE